VSIKGMLTSHSMS